MLLDDANEGFAKSESASCDSGSLTQAGNHLRPTIVRSEPRMTFRQEISTSITLQGRWLKLPIKSRLSLSYSSILEAILNLKRGTYKNQNDLQVIKHTFA